MLSDDAVETNSIVLLAPPFISRYLFARLFLAVAHRNTNREKLIEPRNDNYSTTLVSSNSS